MWWKWTIFAVVFAIIPFSFVYFAVYIATIA